MCVISQYLATKRSLIMNRDEEEKNVLDLRLRFRWTLVNSEYPSNYLCVADGSDMNSYSTAPFKLFFGIQQVYQTVSLVANQRHTNK